MNPLLELSTWYTFIEFAIVVVFGILVLLRPRWFWPLIIIGSIIGQGPRFLGYIIFDEALLWTVVLGALLIIVTTKVKSVPQKPTYQKLIYFLWIGYMIIESVIGIFANDDLRIIRWILFYVLLGLIPLISAYYEELFPFPSLKQTLTIILVTTLVYYIFYLAHGIFYDIFFGELSGRFAAQFLTEGFFTWSGTAIAVFPGLLAIPVVIISFGENDSFGMSLLEWSVAFLMLAAGHYYDSRISFVAVLGCILVSIDKFKIKHIAILLVVFFSTFFLFYRGTTETVDKFIKGIYGGTQALWTEDDEANASDLNRKLQFDAAFLRATDNPVTFLVGDGIYSHRFTIIPYIEKLYALYLPSNQYRRPAGADLAGDVQHVDNWGDFEIFRTTGFTALLIDTGFIGLFLFVMNYIIIGVNLLRQKSAYLLTLLFVLALSFWWLFVNNIVDVIILYLFIMPQGILERLSNSTSRSHIAVRRNI